MEVIFYRHLLFKEELFEEKATVLQEKIKVIGEKPIFLQEETEPLLIFDQTRDRKTWSWVRTLLNLSLKWKPHRPLTLKKP